MHPKDDEADSVAAESLGDSVTTETSHPHLRPILVGYVFGPKKMSTMGIIMAEASRAQLSTIVTAEVPISHISSTHAHSTLTPAALESQSKRSRVVFSMAGGPNGSLRNIVRYFRASCSSVVTSDDSSMEATAATTATGTIPPSTTSSNSLRRPVRVSFVPLDLDYPLEEQHGGMFDAILHKITEDILCLSTMTKDDTDPDEAQLQAVTHVERLNQYREKHPECCLVDDPTHVQVLMSRSDIAHVLKECLVGVVSASGIPVSTPQFEVVTTGDNTSLTLPVIAKPLSAAGTKKSHCMGVVLCNEGLQKVETPCLLQEYANHNATLFKVYVLGDHVSVFQRPSLPNLPTPSSNSYFDYVEFDSQRPYPTLTDFGFPPEAKRLKQDYCPGITTEEIRPVVNVLKKAFGLELFGFDVLVTAGEERELLVVDVNYFPSYKEVANFPSLLANFLTQRAIEGRIKIPPL